MASTSASDDPDISSKGVEELRSLLWGSDVKHDVFRRWTQGFVFSEHELTSLVQYEGGPCSVIAPVQAFLLKNLLFSETRQQNWRHVDGTQQTEFLGSALLDIFRLVQTSDDFTLVNYHSPPSSPQHTEPATSETPSEQRESQTEEEEDENNSPKKRCFSHEQFHAGLKCTRCGSSELANKLKSNMPVYTSQYGILLVLYSIILTKGIEQIKNEVEDPGEPLIDPIHGHAGQSLVNLLITGKAVSNVWDNDQVLSGLKLKGIAEQSTIGFLTLLEHLRYCEVGWYLKNPDFPIWLLGSETHLTVLFSQDRNLVSKETPEAAARRVFSTYDTEGSGFISCDLLGDIMAALDLVSEPEYVKIVREKLDPEQLGIVTLNCFMDEFFPAHQREQDVTTFNLFHYNGLQRSCVGNKVQYQVGEAVLLDMPELQIISDMSPMKTVLMTKWPTVEIKWAGNNIPSLN